MSGVPTNMRLGRLTPKELACLRLVARRMSSKEIAAELGIAKTSVDTYCNRARVKLGVGGRYEAARLIRAASADHETGAVDIAQPPPVGVAPRGVRRAAAKATVRTLSAGALAALALGAFLAGMHALDAMRPPQTSSRHVLADVGQPHAR